MNTTKTSEGLLSVLVVDDSVCYRKIITDTLHSLPGVTVVGTAVNGEIGWEKIRQLQPQLVTLDVKMPGLDGVELLRRIKSTNDSVGVIMLSALTSEGAETATAALRLGAFDFVLKPEGNSFAENVQQLRTDLASKIEAYRKHLERAPRSETPPPVRGTFTPTRSKAVARPEVVVLGISTGGPEALNRLLPQIPGGFPVPIMIVQHMPPVFTRSLADSLNLRTAVTVCEAETGQRLRPGHVYIAPGGRQMRLARQEGSLCAEITDDPAENSCRPAVDYLFRSAAQICGERTLAVIMTGMGSDGTIGCRLLKQVGAPIIAQDRESCVVYGMPLLPTQEGLVQVVAPLAEIARHMVAYIQEKVSHASN
jgi:two-component system, chemotaxis family, protein-glutamate methylesterase/glutaminase